MGADRTGGSGVAVAGILALTLTAIAYGLAPGYVTDRDTYEQIGRQVVIPDCSNLHCTRVLVAWVIELLPGDSLVKWKAYAVLGNLLAALGIMRICQRAGLSFGAAQAAAATSMLGPGAQLTAVDPHTSDPFIYAAVPWLVLLLWDGRFVAATSGAAIGVWAKEFAAAPLWIFALFGALGRRPDLAVKATAAAALVSATWIGQQLWFILGYNYSYGGNSSARILEGAYLATWIRELGPVRAAGSLALHFLPLAVLAAGGWRRSPRSLQLLALASVPAALAFAYVQQPDRAIWNFQFALLPLAALMFQDAPRRLVVTWLTAFAASNLPIDHGWANALAWTGFMISMVSGAALLRSSAGSPRLPNVPIALPREPRQRHPLRWRAAMAGSLVLLILGLIAAGDVAFHRRVETAEGFNVWGYRGPVVKHSDDTRVLVVGGRHVFGHRLETSVPDELRELLNNERLRGDAMYTVPGRIAVINLAEPFEAVRSMSRTLRDAAYLEADVVCLYVGDEQPAPDRRAENEGWRRQSFIYRTFGYLPALPTLFWRGYWPEPPPPAPSRGPRTEAGWRAYDQSLDAAIAAARSRSRVLVATHPILAADELGRQDEVGARLQRLFGGDRGFEHLDLRKVIDPSVLAAPDSKIAESLSQAVFRLLKSR